MNTFEKLHETLMREMRLSMGGHTLCVSPGQAAFNPAGRCRRAEQCINATAYGYSAARYCPRLPGHEVKSQCLSCGHALRQHGADRLSGWQAGAVAFQCMHKQAYGAQVFLFCAGVHNYLASFLRALRV